LRSEEIFLDFKICCKREKPDCSLLKMLMVVVACSSRARADLLGDPAATHRA
jgi:hypothetical protein